MSLKHRWDKIGKRDWDDIRDTWISHVPQFPTLGAAPDPGLERLTSLLALSIPNATTGPAERSEDIEGVRRNALWEAVFLFHKCSHANLAAQRLGQLGMHSWCMFNGYHSAYLGAKGVMTLLGLALANVSGKQIAIDLFPEALKPPKKKNAAHPQMSPKFQEFLVIRLPLLDQRYLWEAFQRVLRQSHVKCWDMTIRKELVSVDYEKVTPPRNHFLYQARFWPLDDLIFDAKFEEMNSLIGTDLDTGEQGFLLRLSFCVYRLFEQLMQDLAQHSAVIKTQLDASRFLSESEAPELGCYKAFLTQVSSLAGAAQ